MTSKNTATKKETTTKTKATGKKPVATPKKENPVAIPKKEESKKIKSSLYVFSKEMVEELDKRTKTIKDSMSKIDSSFESIAFNLYWIYVNEAYKAYGISSIEKYAAKFFGYAKTTCYALIAIIERFAKRDENGDLLEEIDERYKGYSSSKLSLMVGLTDEQIQTSLIPSMSVREIKKYVNSLKEKPLPSLPDGNDDVEGDDNSENVVDSTMVQTFTKRLFVIKGFDDYNKQLDKIDEKIHELYKSMPDVTIRIEIDREKPIEGKWGDIPYGSY